MFIWQSGTLMQAAGAGNIGHIFIVHLDLQYFTIIYYNGMVIVNIQVIVILWKKIKLQFYISSSRFKVCKGSYDNQQNNKNTNSLLCDCLLQ